MSDLRYYTHQNLKKRNFFNNISITGWLILANVLFFFAANVLILINKNYAEYIALQPSYIFQLKYFWTILTSMFTHISIFHLIVNMFVLFSLGSFCEKIIGRKRFFWFYMISGIIAGVMFVVLAGLFGNTELGAKIFGSPFGAGVGASGAIFAIAALFMVLTPRMKFAIIFLPFFSLPAYFMIPLVLFATWLVSAGAGLSIGNTAHFGGFVAGIFYGLYLKLKYPRKIKILNESIR